VNAWPTLNAAAAPADTDHDGMPDYWEASRGLNASDAADRNLYSSTGYTNLEDYLNGVIGTVSIQTKTGTTEATIRVYPNPADTEVTLAHPASGTATLYDAQGKQLAHQKIARGAEQSRFSTAALAPGTYFIVYRNGKSSASVSFIKQ
jgi:hypothetical protein